MLTELSGETTIRYTPLAALCLKASIDADPRLRGRVSARILAFTQGHTCAEMVSAIVAQSPDVVALSCQGWNFRQLTPLFCTLKQFLPAARLVLGGNHVSGRAERLLPAYPAVDVIVNGEGEFTFADLLVALLDGAPLAGVAGLSARGPDGQVFTTPERPRTREMTEIASPYLLRDVQYGGFDVALLETNRGCPYACAFCYWGGRIGQKIARGRVDRVREELEVIGAAGIPTLFLCDANFGIVPEDLEIAHLVVAARRRWGAPAELNVNWAKNHSARVGEIIRVLQEGGVRTLLNIPLQTLSPEALRLSGRSEAGRAEMTKLARRLTSEGTELYCELIYGLPGESLAAFKANYDTLYVQFPVLRIHPLWLLPNTTYERERDTLGIRTLSPDPTSDYEAVVQHARLSMDEMREGLAMLLAHSILSLLGPARNTLRLLARHDGRSSAATLCALEGYLAGRGDELARALYALFGRIRRACYFERALRAEKRALLFGSRQATFELLAGFFEAQGLPPTLRGVALELLAFDCALLPRSELAAPGVVHSGFESSFDPLELCRRLLEDGDGWRDWLGTAAPTRTILAHRGGLAVLDGRNCDLTGSWHGRVARRGDAPPGERAASTTDVGAT